MPRGLNKIELARQYIARFPKAHTQTLAKKAYQEHPALWPNQDACRTSFRRARGAQGALHRKYATSPQRSASESEHSRESPFGKLPDGKQDMPGWGPLVIDPPVRALVIGDVHVPYHNREIYELACRRGLDRGVDCLLLNGDILDCHAISRYECDPRERKFSAEIEALRNLLEATAEIFPKARRIYKLGNHEERYESYMWCKAPELLDLAEFSFRSVARLDEYGYEMVTDRRVVRLASLNVIHGHEYRFSISNPVNPARGLFLRGKVHSITSHFHQPSYHGEPTMEDKPISCWSTGCACDLHPRYMPLNKWIHGFCIVDVDEDGGFAVDNYRVIHGRVYS